jgi:hypothetical protein
MQPFVCCFQTGGGLVKSVVSSLDTPEKPQPDLPETAESPRAVSKEGRRSRIARRALAVFRMSRSVSTDRVHEASLGLITAADNTAAWTYLEAGKLQASVERREQIGDCQRFVNGVPLLSRRLSMGDCRVDESGSFERRLSWDDLVRLGSLRAVFGMISRFREQRMLVVMYCIAWSGLFNLTGFWFTVQMPDLSPLLIQTSVDDLQEAKATEQGKTLPRPTFLERMTIQSVDLKPW